MEELGLRPLRAATLGGRAIDAPAVRRQHHAVVLLGAVAADEAAAHVGEHTLHLALEGMAPAAAAAGLDAHDVAAPHDVAVAERRDDARAGAAWIDDAASGA